MLKGKRFYEFGPFRLDPAERLLTVTLLLQRYRTMSDVRNKQEPIDAEESKLILQTLLDTQDWTRFDATARTTPMLLFQQLGLTAQDGWNPPQPQAGQNYQEVLTTAARQWLTQNAAKYRIQRYAPHNPK